MNNQRKGRIENYLKLSLLGIMPILFIGFIPSSQFGPTDPECFELGNCNLFERPFDAMIEPYNATLGDFTLVAIWAIIIGILWLRVSNTMMVGLVGVALAGLFTQGFSAEAQIIGYGLLAVAIAVALYQIFLVRVHFPTN